MDSTSWHALNSDEVLKRLSTRLEGLTASEAADRLGRFGHNVLTRSKPISPGRLLLRQFANLFIAILIFAAGLAYAISFMPGEGARALTAYFILGIVVLSVLLSFFQEYRARKELDALSRLLVYKAKVVRDGAALAINSADVVPGDIVVLSQGQKVPADLRVIEAHALRADESALTGESLAVDKAPQPAPADAPLAERSGMLYATTYITAGSGLAVAVRTGMATEVGLIAATLQQMAERPTPFQAEVQKMARQMTVIVGVAASLIAAFLLFVLHEHLVDVALNTLSLAVATIPESLPIVLTFALALGAHQMARRNVVVRRLSLVESLGSVDTICTDKTGTLTQNVMTVQRLFADGRTDELPQGTPSSPALAELLRAGVLCNDASVESDAAHTIIGDPVDAALLRAARQAGFDADAVRRELPKANAVPFSSERKMMTTIHQRDGRFRSYTKGAPEAVLPRCASLWQPGAAIPLDADTRKSIQSAVEELQRGAWYVLAIAQREVASPQSLRDAEDEMAFVGLQAMMDPPRNGAAEAIAQTKEARIRVVMITGDNSLTAQAVGKRLGMGARTIEARDLDPLQREDLQQRMQETDIVARATPETKQRVLQALQDAGHFVAMTGDGVNDATALKQADVGVAMGLRGTDVAKESAGMVLLDDNFATIVAGVEEGRRIFDNIRKFTNYLLSTSLGSLVVVLVLSFAGYFPLSAQMLLWVNLVTDLIPASALAADPAVPHVMRRRPRRHDEPIMNKAIYATVAGSIFRTLIAYCLIFWVGLHFGGITYARTMLFTSIVLHAFTRVMVVRQLDNLSLWSNKALLWSYGAAVGLQLLALYTPLREVFGVVPLDWRAWAVMLPVVAVSSAAGVYMTRWILKLIPLWGD